MKRNTSIQLIRIIAMFMIFLDHLLVHVQFPMQPLVVQVANSGVLIFLFISGFLYGNKNVTDWKQWFIKRIVRVCIPMWIFMIFDFLLEALVWNTFELKYVFFYLFNLQGILGTAEGAMNLWFLTLIMICYIITPLLQWIKGKINNISVAVIALLIGIAIQIVLAYTTNIGMVAGHTLSWCVIAVGVYVVGYFGGNRICNDNISLKRIAAVSLIVAVTSVVVVLCRKYFDGEIIYDRIIIFYGMVMIDLWLVTVLYKIGSFIKGEHILKIINHFDAISYEFYIVHGLITLMLTIQWIYSGGIALYIFGTLIMSYIAACILHGICSLVYKAVKI